MSDIPHRKIEPLRFLLTAALLATIAVYWAGLSGPLLFDDAANLAQIQRWLEGRANLYEAVFGTQSGLLLRPVSMATLALNAWMTDGIQPVLMKLTNLLLHLACGVFLWRVVRLLMSRDERLAPYGMIVASCVAGLWLLHPLNASTVLYVVQRMAQLSALFMLICLWIYVSARFDQSEGRSSSAAFKLFLLFPTFFALGLLSKENAAVVPALCLVIELAWLHGLRGGRVLKGFYAAFLLLPAILGITLMTMFPQRVLAGYAMRDFSIGERLLSEGRVLVDYVAQGLLPQGPRMGLYHDDFIPSTGLFSPPSTFVAIALLLTLTALAWYCRRRAPGVFAGWFIFVVGHAVESTILPLELYFEHRNYLPLMGLLLAGVSGIGYLLPRVTGPQARSTFATVVGVGTAIAFGIITFQFSQRWQSIESIASQGVQQHPESLRARLDLATAMLHSGRYSESRTQLEYLAMSKATSHRTIGHLGVAALDCIQHKQADPENLHAAMDSTGDRVTLADYQAYGLLARVISDTNCRGATPNVVADAILAALNKARGQPDTGEPKWRMRLIATQVLASAGRPAEALEQARMAWQPTADFAVGSSLVQLALHQGDLPLAERTIEEMKLRAGKHEDLAIAEISRMQSLLDQARSAQAAPKR